MAAPILALDVAHLVAVVFTALRDHLATEGADIVLVVAVVVVHVIIELLGILNGFAKRNRLVPVLEPRKARPADILRLRREVVDLTVI